MKGMYITTISYARATAKIDLANLTYNLMRCVQLNKKVDTVFLNNYAVTNPLLGIIANTDLQAFIGVIKGFI